MADQAMADQGRGPVPRDRTSSRPLRADAERNRRQLVEAARSAFTKHGVSASLDDVARAAGVGPGTLYRHFPTRDLLVVAVIDDGLLGIRDLALTMLNDADPVRALHAWLSAYIEQGNVFKGLAETLVRPSEAGENSACRAARDAGTALLERAVHHGDLRDDTRPQDVLDMAAAIAWIGEQPDRDPAQRDRLLELLVDGLRCPPVAQSAG
ncbi:MAG: TetR/AcrR family transcriptional regulator [Mycobacterium sp.]